MQSKLLSQIASVLGIQTINGDSSGAQTIQGTPPIQVSTTGGTTTISDTIATASVAGYVTTVQQTFGGAKNILPVGLTDGATVSIDASLSNIFTLISTQNPTLNAPTNPVNGQKMTIIFRAQSGIRTLSLTTGSNGSFTFGTDITTLTATATGTQDFIGCIYYGLIQRWCVVAYAKGF